MNGPFPCGEWPDLSITCNALVDLLDDREIFLADGGYSAGNGYSDTPAKWAP